MAQLGLPRKELRREEGKGKVVPVTWSLKKWVILYYVHFTSINNNIIVVVFMV